MNARAASRPSWCSRHTPARSTNSSGTACGNTRSGCGRSLPARSSAPPGIFSIPTCSSRTPSITWASRENDGAPSGWPNCLYKSWLRLPRRAACATDPDRERSIFFGLLCYTLETEQREEAAMELNRIAIRIPDGCNIILGQAHFIKTIEDLYEVLATTAPRAGYGAAFTEASGPCLIRSEGNDQALVDSCV